MAKRRRVNHRTPHERGAAPIESGTPLVSGYRGLDPAAIAIGMLAGAVVYVAYYPSDSVAVEKGDALWLAALALIIATIACATRSGLPIGPWRRRNSNPSATPEPSFVNGVDQVGSGQSSYRILAVRLAATVLDVVPWLLAAWMMLAAFGSSPPGNLRLATNEGWFWVTAACLFTAARNLLVALSVRQSIMGLLVICGCGLSVHGMHQYAVSLPEIRAEYEKDPEGVLQKAMLDAPPGSSERMVFENRLMDGGPTASFALANSLAGVLLTSVVFAVGMVAFGWRQMHPLQRASWVSMALLCAACLMAARSRSATLAMLIGLALLLIAVSHVFERRRKLLGWGLFGLLVAGGSGAVILAIFGNREWFEEAPASLAFRFQYWRSTWQMVLEHPLFGAGPGNFQAIYERYREASATEQIAEPHNFLMETLAAGGFVGLGLLILCGVGVLMIAWFRGERSRVTAELECRGDTPQAVGFGETDQIADNCDSSASTSLLLSRWVWLGAIVAFGMIWLLGWASRQPPDLEASLYVVPAVILIGWMVAATVDKISSRDLDVVLGIAMVSIAIHLMISGGWTVPGVAIVIWLGAGMWARVPVAMASEQWTIRSPFKTVAVMVIGVGLLFTLWVCSLRPVEQQRLWMTRVVDAQARGRSENAREALLQALAADRWSPDAALWLADFYRWQLVRGQDSIQTRQRWEAALKEGKVRAGEDPAIYRMIGAQQMHVFQKWGVPGDLDAAAESFEAALGWSPANEWMFAQMSAIDQVRGNGEAAARYFQTAETLSRQGGNIERALSRQMVYIPGKLGAPADRGPVRVAADKLFAEPNGQPSRISAD